VRRDKTRQSGIHDFDLMADALKRFRQKSVSIVICLRRRSPSKLRSLS